MHSNFDAAANRSSTRIYSSVFWIMTFVFANVFIHLFIYLFISVHYFLCVPPQWMFIQVTVMLNFSFGERVK